jgi:hypothetical protein
VKLVEPGSRDLGSGTRHSGFGIRGAASDTNAEPRTPNAAPRAANLEQGTAHTLGDPATFSFLTLSTKPTLRAEYAAAAGGKTAVYMARWVSTQGEKGPWSEVTTATVAA